MVTLLHFKITTQWPVCNSLSTKPGPTDSDHPFEPTICEAMANHYDSTGQPGLANSYRSMARPK
ncbi:MAG: hypothetical protein WCJ40_19530 [Planctomycetota bacterium]